MASESDLRREASSKVTDKCRNPLPNGRLPQTSISSPETSPPLPSPASTGASNTPQTATASEFDHSHIPVWPAVNRPRPSTSSQVSSSQSVPVSIFSQSLTSPQLLTAPTTPSAVSRPPTSASQDESNSPHSSPIGTSNPDALAMLALQPNPSHSLSSGESLAPGVQRNADPNQETGYVLDPDADAITNVPGPSQPPAELIRPLIADDDPVENWSIKYEPGMLARLGLKEGSYPKVAAPGKAEQPPNGALAHHMPNTAYIAYLILAKGGRMSKEVLCKTISELSPFHRTAAKDQTIRACLCRGNAFVPQDGMWRLANVGEVLPDKNAGPAKGPRTKRKKGDDEDNEDDEHQDEGSGPCKKPNREIRGKKPAPQITNSSSSNGTQAPTQSRRESGYSNKTAAREQHMTESEDITNVVAGPSREAETSSGITKPTRSVRTSKATRKMKGIATEKEPAETQPSSSIDKTHITLKFKVKFHTPNTRFLQRFSDTQYPIQPEPELIADMKEARQWQRTRLAIKRLRRKHERLAKNTWQYKNGKRVFTDGKPIQCSAWVEREKWEAASTQRLSRPQVSAPQRLEWAGINSLCEELNEKRKESGRKEWKEPEVIPRNFMHPPNSNEEGGEGYGHAWSEIAEEGKDEGQEPGKNLIDVEAHKVPEAGTSNADWDEFRQLKDGRALTWSSTEYIVDLEKLQTRRGSNDGGSKMKIEIRREMEIDQGQDSDGKHAQKI